MDLILLYFHHTSDSIVLFISIIDNYPLIYIFEIYRLF